MHPELAQGAHVLTAFALLLVFSFKPRGLAASLFRMFLHFGLADSRMPPFSNFRTEYRTAAACTCFPAR